MTIPSPAAGSDLEPAIDEVLVDMTNVCSDCEHPGCLAQLKAGRKRILNLIAAQNNAIYEAVMGLLKDEDEYPNIISTRDGHTKSHNVNAMFHNQLRADLRQSIAKIFGKESSDE